MALFPRYGTYYDFPVPHLRGYGFFVYPARPSSPCALYPVPRTLQQCVPCTLL